jgi:hypothetical protein
MIVVDFGCYAGKSHHDHEERAPLVLGTPLVRGSQEVAERRGAGEGLELGLDDAPATMRDPP